MPQNGNLRVNLEGWSKIRLNYNYLKFPEAYNIILEEDYHAKPIGLELSLK